MAEADAPSPLGMCVAVPLGSRDPASACREVCAQLLSGRLGICSSSRLSLSLRGRRAGYVKAEKEPQPPKAPRLATNPAARRAFRVRDGMRNKLTPGVGGGETSSSHALTPALPRQLRSQWTFVLGFLKPCRWWPTRGVGPRGVTRSQKLSGDAAAGQSTRELSLCQALGRVVGR